MKTKDRRQSKNIQQGAEAPVEALPSDSPFVMARAKQQQDVLRQALGVQQMFQAAVQLFQHPEMLKAAKTSRNPFGAPMGQGGAYIPYDGPPDAIIKKTSRKGK